MKPSKIVAIIVLLFVGLFALNLLAWLISGARAVAWLVVGVLVVCAIAQLVTPRMWRSDHGG